MADKYYTIFNNGLLTAETEDALAKFYDNVRELPDDYLPNKYIVVNGELVLNPNYEEEEAEKERIRISHLKCTKRVLVLMLEQLQYNYFDVIQPLIDANRQAKLEWELCVELERSNPLLNTIGGQLGITSEQIDAMFKYANGEITEQEFLGE